MYTGHAREDGGIHVPDARQVREFEAKNGKRKKLRAVDHLDIHAPNTGFGVKR